jgi:hypothetical protein
LGCLNSEGETSVTVVSDHLGSDGHLSQRLSSSVAGIVAVVVPIDGGASVCEGVSVGAAVIEGSASVADSPMPKCHQAEVASSATPAVTMTVANSMPNIASVVYRIAKLPPEVIETSRRFVTPILESSSVPAGDSPRNPLSRPD